VFHAKTQRHRPAKGAKKKRPFLGGTVVKLKGGGHAARAATYISGWGGAVDCLLGDTSKPGLVRLYFTVKLAAVVLVPPGVVTVIGPLVAPSGTVAQT